MKTARLADHTRRPQCPAAFPVLGSGASAPVYPHFLHPHWQHQERGAHHPSRRTFQELAEVKVVLHDHMRDHLLVEADDLEQDGFQKNGFCII